MRPAISLVAGALLAACASAAPPAKAPAPPAAAPARALDKESWRDTPPKPAPAQAFEYPVAQEARLDNGMRVLCLETSTPLVSVSFVLRRGATSDPLGKSGLLALTSRLLVEETKDKDSLTLAEAVESLGSQLEARTGHDHTVVSLEFLRQDIATGFDLLAEVVTTPSFRPKVVERVRAEWLDGLVSERQKPSQLANIVGMRALLGPELGAPTDGSTSEISELSSADLRAAHQEFYEPSSAALVVVGGARFGSVVEQAKQAFSKWTPHVKKIAAQSRTAGHRHEGAILVDRPGAVQSAIFVALGFPPRQSEGFERRELLNQVLGGMFTSRLNQNLREKHAFTYGAFSQNYATNEFGVWELNTSVRAQDTGPAVREILRELESIRSSRPVTSVELARAKRELLGRYSAHLERSSDIADDIVELFVDRLKLDYVARLRSTLDTIGVDDVQREAEQRLSTRELTVVVVGDTKRIQGPLQSILGRVSLAPAQFVD